MRPKRFTELTGHLLLYSKGHYGRTVEKGKIDIIADLRKFMVKWSSSPEEYYTPIELYRIISGSFVEACNKGQIREFIDGLFNPINLFYANKKTGEPLTIEEAIVSMIGLMSIVQIRDGETILVELPEKNPNYVIGEVH